MRLDLDSQEIGETELVIDSPLSLELGEGSPEAVSLKGTLKIQDMESRILINGELNATGQASCARCLTDFPLAWHVPVVMMVLRNQDTDEDDDSVIVVTHQRGVADLEPGLRECTLLAYPQSVVCREDCLGICVSCGADLNEKKCDCRQEATDPRWDALP